eukprot:SAG31_NODE_358_length_17033_cov_11.747077_6_plen_211_part_00
MDVVAVQDPLFSAPEAEDYDGEEQLGQCDDHCRVTLSRLVPGFSVRTWEIQREKANKNEKVTVDFSVRLWEIQEENSHTNEKVTLLTADALRQPHAVMAAAAAVHAERRSRDHKDQQSADDEERHPEVNLQPRLWPESGPKCRNGIGQRDSAPLGRNSSSSSGGQRRLSFTSPRRSHLNSTSIPKNSSTAATERSMKFSTPRIQRVTHAP